MQRAAHDSLGFHLCFTDSEPNLGFGHQGQRVAGSNADQFSFAGTCRQTSVGLTEAGPVQVALRTGGHLALFRKTLNCQRNKSGP